MNGQFNTSLEAYIFVERGIQLLNKGNKYLHYTALNSMHLNVHCHSCASHHDKWHVSIQPNLVQSHILNAASGKLFPEVRAYCRITLASFTLAPNLF